MHNKYINAFQYRKQHDTPLPNAGYNYSDDDEDDDLPDNPGNGNTPSPQGREKSTQRRNVSKGDNNGTPVIDKYGKDITRAAARGEFVPKV